jgi:hypothetical protein
MFTVFDGHEVIVILSYFVPDYLYCGLTSWVCAARLHLAVVEIGGARLVLNVSAPFAQGPVQPHETDWHAMGVPRRSLLGQGQGR